MQLTFPARVPLLPRFLLILCNELQRINTFVGKLAEDKFAKLDVSRSGQVSGVRGVRGVRGVE